MNLGCSSQVPRHRQDDTGHMESTPCSPQCSISTPGVLGGWSVQVMPTPNLHLRSSKVLWCRGSAFLVSFCEWMLHMVDSWQRRISCLTMHHRTFDLLAKVPWKQTMDPYWISAMKRVSNLQPSSYRRLPIAERPGLLPNFCSSLCRRHWRPVNGDLQCFAGWRERTATDDNATIWWNSWSLVLPVHKGPNEPESMRATDCYGQLQNFQYFKRLLAAPSETKSIKLVWYGCVWK